MLPARRDEEEKTPQVIEGPSHEQLLAAYDEIRQGGMPILSFTFLGAYPTEGTSWLDKLAGERLPTSPTDVQIFRMEPEENNDWVLLGRPVLEGGPTKTFRISMYYSPGHQSGRVSVYSG